MDLDKLSEIAIKNGVEGVVLETHKNWVDKDPIKSLQVSSEYMQKNLVTNKILVKRYISSYIYSYL